MEALLPALRRLVDARIAEITPIAEELAQLQSIRPLLDEQASTDTTSTPAGATRRRRRLTPARTTGARRRAAPGANRDAILAAVTRQPGITAAEIAEITGIAKATVHATIPVMCDKNLLHRRAAGGLELSGD